MRVLLIEDDYAVSQSVETILKKEGMVVDTTDDGEDGLDCGKLYDYDIIILDLNLPGMNGYEVLKSLRNAKITTPVLILSGLSHSDTPRKRYSCRGRAPVSDVKAALTHIHSQIFWL